MKQHIFSQLEDYCQRLFGDNSQDYLSIFASLLSVLPEDYPSQLISLDSQGYQGKVFNSIREWLTALSEQIPVVVSLRSIQWANSASVDLLRNVITLSKNHPILWLIDYRPDIDSPVPRLEKFITSEQELSFQKVTLPPLNNSEAETLIDYFLQPGRLAQDAKAKIAARADGNPYFIQELLKNLKDEGILVNDQRQKQWRLAEPIDKINLPGSLQSLFLSRIDKLSTDERTVLQIASAVGYLFWAEVIEKIAPIDVQVEPALESLQKGGFIEKRSVNHDLGSTFVFLSTLIRDVTYDALLSNQKVSLHKQIAELLRNHIDNQEVNPSQVAYQYQMAGNLRLELLYRIDAAARSARAYANDDAYQQYSLALAILDHLEEENHDGNVVTIESQRFELVKARIDVLYHLGRVFEAQSEARRLLSIADNIPDEPVWRIDALLMQPGVNFIENRESLQEGIPQAEEALALSRELGDQHRELMSLSAVVNHKILVKDPDWKNLGEEAIAIAEDLGDNRKKVDLLLMMTDAYGLDDLDQGLGLIKTAYTLAKEINYRGAQVELLYWLGAEFEREGDYVTLLNDFEEKRLKLSQELGLRLVEARSLMFMGQIEGLYLGDFQQGLSYLNKAEALWRDVDFRLFVYLRKAQILIELDRLKEAWRYLELAKPLVADYVEGIGNAGFELVKAIYHIKRNTLDCLMEAIHSTTEVLRMVDEQNLVSRQYRMAAACKAAQAMLKLAEFLKQKNDLSGSKHFCQKALKLSSLATDTYNTFGFTQVIEVVAEEIMYTKGLALLANNQNEEGWAFIEKAYGEMSRKLALIPKGSPYKETYLNMSIHQEINKKHKEIA